MSNPTQAPSSHSTLSVAAILAESATRHPDKVALVLGEQRTTYRELWDQTRAYAGALRARGIGPGDTVAVLLPNVPDFARAYYGVLALGATVVPVHALLKAREIEYVLRDSGARAILVGAPMLAEGGKAAAAAGVDALTLLVPDEQADAVPFPRLEDEAAAAPPIDTYVPVAPGATATVLYTSGTTGEPKGAMGSHLALVEQVNVMCLDTLPMSSADVILGCLPFFHTFGQTCALNASFRVGATVVLLPRFDGDAALQLMNAHGVTIMMGVPTMHLGLVQAAAKNPERPPLRYGVSGGAALPLAALEAFSEAFGVPIHEGYGLTETSPVASFNHIGVPIRPGTVGQPIWGVDVEIADPLVRDRTELLPHGELGEIVIRGHNLFQGYLNRPEATAEAVVDGWFRSGDLGTKDDDGYVTILDRTKDMIIRNGYNVYPREVEEVLVRHPAIHMAAVFGVPDDTHGQEIHAAVVLKDGAEPVTGDELVAWVKQDVAAYKYPRVIRVLDELPLGPSGKILKRELVARLERSAG
ncbi:long-chain acyl-CoA synthetase [Sediminihabitans luteus]|uniref:Long-chain acyl-CoA synthetase n=1 Tax=Sediminihabitans luteus TaxID=1138585 RepID=A0A2M9CD45_9CELL|nr:long-chain fatty acid--CoA ligase [Sediminihabitans luteus]PJJ69268.1 long-chain acyl-CoA synthetase [Sediminihabitans luteus]GII98944.1 AMP-dependent synthetase [Sediminihabitans luteus]